MLPRRDIVLLPMIALLTASILVVIAEIVAQIFFADERVDACVLSAGHFRPNCVSYLKAAEGPLTTNAFNECGYRTKESCGTKPTGTIRVAVLGSSFTEGYLVPYDETLAPIAAKRLSQACNGPVEFQNLSFAGSELPNQPSRLDEVLALRPDVVLSGVTTYEAALLPAEKLAYANLTQPVTSADTPPRPSLITQIRDSTVMRMAEHFAFQDTPTYVRLWLLYGDKADYLRPPFTTAWQNRFQNADTIYGEMAQRIHAGGADFVMLLGMQRIQAALLNEGMAPPGVDLGAFSKRMREIADRHHIAFYDGMESIASQLHPEMLFYTADGHLAADGQHLLADALVRRLLAGDVRAFAGCHFTVEATGE
jgi:hypothetical protein